MNSIKTKISDFLIINNKAIAGVSILPKNNHWAIAVAWEWQDQALNSFFAITEMEIENTNFNFNEVVNYVADYGEDVTHLQSKKALFPNLF